MAVMNGNLPSLRQACAEHCLLCCSHSEPNCCWACLCMPSDVYTHHTLRDTLLQVLLSFSFHVGSGAQSATAYANALSSAKEIFTAAVSLSLVNS